MVQNRRYICLVAVVSLVASVIWPALSIAAPAPQLEMLSEIRDGLRVPTRIDVDAEGNLYVADCRNESIVKYDRFGQQAAVFKLSGMSGAGLAVSADGSHLFAAARDRVITLRVADLQQGMLGRGAGEFDSAGFIDVDHQGYVYVVDHGQKRVKVYNPAGVLQKTISGQFQNISSLAVSTQYDDDPANDEIFITDSFVATDSQPALYVYNYAGTLLRTLQASTDFSDPVRIFGKPTFDDAGRYYIGDVEQHRLHIVSLADSPTTAGTPLISPLGNSGDVQSPIDLAFDRNTQRLFVLYGDRCVRVYGVDGAQAPVQANSVPSVPQPVAPIGGSETATAQPLLQFNNSEDADPADSLTYSVQLLNQAQQLVASFEVAEQSELISVPVAEKLTENQQYFWQVQATDGKDVSAWSELQSFYVNAEQEPPGLPVLISPLAGVGVKGDGILSWQASVDSDPGDEVSYQLIISDAADMAKPVHSLELSGTELAMSEWSPLLQPGQEYFWKTVAIDNHGLTSSSSEDGRFTFQASVLKITATMPDARVYLGGNIAYAGQYVGKAPLELRDLPVGRYQVVVERAGFEPYLQAVDVQEEQASEVYARLKPALEVGKLKFKPIKLAGKKVRFGSQVNPLLSDIDLDGVEDLLLATADGRLHYHPGVLENEAEYNAGTAQKRKIEFAAEQPLELPQVPAAAPLLVDWNNDNQQDLLIGSADGSVNLFLNLGEMKFSAEAVQLAAVSDNAVPAVVDFDGDNDKDLVVGSGDGELVLLENKGSDSAPLLDEATLLIAFAGPAAPYFADLDGNGQRELLVVNEGMVFRADYAANALQKLTRVKTENADVSSVNVFNLDGHKGIDLIAGTADGRLLLAQSKDSTPVADCLQAFEEKLELLRKLVADADQSLLPMVDSIGSGLENSAFETAAVEVDALASLLPADSVAAQSASDIAETLKWLLP